MSCIPIQDFSLISLCDATKAGKLYSIVPDSGAGDFDVTRASTATYIGSDGLLKTAANNEPRIEFNPDGSYKGLLVEPSGTNLALRSEEFDDAYWVKIAVSVTANQAVAPDGATTGDKLIASATTGNHFTTIGANIQPDIRCFSVYAKASEYSFVRLGDLNAGRYDTWFDLSAGTAHGTGSSIQNVGNGWYRCIVTYNGNNANVANSISPIPSAGSSANFTGDGTSGIFIWGAQLEVGSVATSYIPTVASTVTRAADVITRTGASALIGQTEGTLYAEVNTRVTGVGINTVGKRILTISIGTLSDRIEIIKGNNDSIEGVVVVGNSTQAFLATSSNQQGNFKIAFAYAANDFVLYVNGTQIGTATSSSVPACSQINLGSRVDNAGFFNDHIRAAAILPTRLSNAQLQQLTTL